MSDLLAAIAGLENATEPFPGFVTGGQPQTSHLAALKAAGCEVVIDVRDPMEPRPYRAPDAVRDAGLEYRSIPVPHGAIPDGVFAAMRAAARDVIGRRAAFCHCNSGNRVGAGLLPYMMLDRGMTEDDAVTRAMQMGMRDAGLLESALDYVRRSAA